jgi:dipeptidyl aminopeptidase/acylaminoacyl peptidase
VEKPFGTWRSPISAAAVAAQGLRLGSVAVDGDDIYWIEGRPGEGGRNVLMRRRPGLPERLGGVAPGGAIAEMTPPEFNVRTRVHEYGGGAYVVSGGCICFANFSDQRVYRIGGSARYPAGSTKQDPADTAAVALTPRGAWCYADFIVDEGRGRLICVREEHRLTGEPVNTVVSIPIDGGETAGEVLASGYDFYSTPRLSPDGRRLSWLAWRHPQMPWDGTELWVADVTDSGSLANAARVAGSESESIYQPGWSPDGALYYVSDRTGWWTLYRGEEPVVVDPPELAEFGRPQWIFGTATWAFAGRSRIIASYTQRGRWHLALIEAATGSWRRLAADLEPYDWLAATETEAILVAGSATRANAVVRVTIDSGAVETLRESSTVELDPADISVAETIEFPTTNGRTAHAFYYPPRNAGAVAPGLPERLGPPRNAGAVAPGLPERLVGVPPGLPECLDGVPPGLPERLDGVPSRGERAPLIAIGHGGPTTAATGTLDVRIQFWTTRGFGVVDVNYGGSSGYGRAYRQRLMGQWGIVDVADMIAAVRHLVGEGRADPHRLIIRGGSAGGYTALAALTFHPGVFNAGASYYGICDIEVLARDTHKFESRYLDGLVGPYPAMRDVYRARSPIHFVDQLSCPLILFQGLEDKVVPPNQSQMMADAVRRKKLPVAYLTFDGEQHGFRKAETIIRSFEAELYFYGAVFGFTPADSIAAIKIDNLQSSPTGEVSGN